MTKIEVNKITKNYKTKIVLVTNEDKKELLTTFFLTLKIVNFIIFPVSILLFGFAIDLKIEELGNEMITVLSSVFILMNLAFLIWYFFLKQQLKNPSKIIYTGIVTDIEIVNRGKYSHALLFFGADSFPVFGNHLDEIASIGSLVSLHYFQKSKITRGDLIRLEKH